MKWHYTIWEIDSDNQGTLLTEYGFITFKHKAISIAKALAVKSNKKIVVRKVSVDTDLCYEWEIK